MNNVTLIDRVRTKILLKHPFFASLMYEAKFDLTDNAHIERAGVTADFRVFLNEKWFNQLTVYEGVFVVCHELMHPMLHHFTRCGARHPVLWNIAAFYLYLLEPPPWPAAAMIAALAAGCMADPAAGDLPWAKQETWEGTPALPSGMFQPR